MVDRPPEPPDTLAHLRSALEAGERERARIALDLHDQLGQQLSTLTLRLGMLRASPGIDAGTREALAGLEALARQADDDLDELVLRLRPVALDELGLAEVLRDHVEAWSRQLDVRARLALSGLEGARLHPDVETAIYRVAQEALNNVGKHAGASSVDIHLDRAEGLVTMTVRDDGRGFEAGPAGSRPLGMGLAGMRERAALVGGRVEVRSRPGDGTTVTLRVPAEGGHGR